MCQCFIIYPYGSQANIDRYLLSICVSYLHEDKIQGVQIFKNVIHI